MRSWKVVHQDGRCIELEPGSRFSLGRDRAADLVLAGQAVSRTHAWLWWPESEDGPRVVDQQSTNGVFMNGRRVTDAPLRHGATIVIGDHRLSARAPDGRQATRGAEVRQLSWSSSGRMQRFDIPAAVRRTG